MFFAISKLGCFYFYLFSMFEKSFEYANLSNLVFIEKIYKEFLEDPSSVEPSWRYFFQGMEMAASMQQFPYKAPAASASSVALLIEHYRSYGHLQAHSNPLQAPAVSDRLSLEAAMLTTKQLTESFDTCGLLPLPQASLQEILNFLQKIYCGSIGVEAMHADPQVQHYIYKTLESERPTIVPIEVLEQLNRSESFESFLHLKHPGQKRFSLEGAESLIPMMDAFLKSCCQQGVKSCFIAMAHRGRLNVLTNIMNKSYAEVFEEFMPGYIPPAAEGSGDVKYHKGYKSIYKDGNGHELTLELCPNPSHLESVDPILEGVVKAKQVLQGSCAEIVPLMIHGDAALAGQGVVYEVLQMSKIEGYSTGGTVHMVINNQIGYTALPSEGRSTFYCTDIAKGFGIPVFHVNAEDPEACVVVATLASAIRQKFGIDVFIDLIGYRKYGHSEGDEPSFTQPLMYEKIRNRQNVRDLYKEKLIKDNILTQMQASLLQEKFLALLEKAQQEVLVLANKPQQITTLKVQTPPIPTAISHQELLSLAERFCQMPADFQLHPKIARLFQDRLSAIKHEQLIDWGLAEYLAYATLLQEGIPVRISGQDCRRGTFAHRHAGVVDQRSDKKYFPLAHLSATQGHFSVYNSLLSEFGVLGFEYGYALAIGKGLTIWEAQFGDFANSAQIILDQFISSSEQKWGVKSPITLMLPHGYEGGGPEHSSARLERYLQLCAQDNMRIVVPSCSSQVFHVLREQGLQASPCPLILFNPKSMLRFTPSLSSFQEFTSKGFEKIFVDRERQDAKKILFCSGKVYYDLVQERDKIKNTSTAIIRIDQLYPLSSLDLKEALSLYPLMESCAFVQEEPENMGAYFHIAPLLTEILPDKIKLCYVGRARSASPAAGSLALHNKEKEKFLQEAFK